jgi:hypothetical protein
VDVSIQPVAAGEVLATSLTFDPKNGGVDYGYTISGADLPQPTTVDLYWANGTTNGILTTVAPD